MLQERGRELRTVALLDFPVGTRMGRPFAGADEVSRVVVGRTYDFQTPNRWGWCLDGDWEVV